MYGANALIFFENKIFFANFFENFFCERFFIIFSLRGGIFFAFCVFYGFCFVCLMFYNSI